MGTKFKYLLRYLPYLLVFISSLFIPKDPDLGWHLKYGEYFLKHGQVLRENIYSTMMPNFNWANTSWMVDILTFFFYQIGGFFGLTILGSVVITLTFFVYSKAAKLEFWDETLLFPLILIFENPVNAVSFRGQLISILFLGILFYLLFKFEENPRTRKIYLILPLFLVWVNSHGQFILGLVILFIWSILKLVTTYVVQKPRMSETLKEAKILVPLCLGATLINLANPFGIAIYEQSLTHFGNPNLKYIAEYLPFYDLSSSWWNQIIVGMMLLFGIIFAFFSEQIKTKAPLTGVLLLLYLLSFLVRRYAWSLYYLTLPIFKNLSNFFKPEKEKTLYISASIFLVISIGWAIYLKWPFNYFWQMNWGSYCQNYVGCSEDSAKFVIDNKLNQNIMTFYDWGGWLIWNHPEIKPNIDGRMHLWRDKSGFSAFSDYYPYEQNWKDINSSKYDVVYMTTQKPVYDRLEQLVKEGRWKQVYRDDFAGVFVKIK